MNTQELKDQFLNEVSKELDELILHADIIPDFESIYVVSASIKLIIYDKDNNSRQVNGAVFTSH